MRNPNNFPRSGKSKLRPSKQSSFSEGGMGAPKKTPLIRNCLVGHTPTHPLYFTQNMYCSPYVSSSTRTFLTAPFDQVFAAPFVPASACASPTRPRSTGCANASPCSRCATVHGRYVPAHSKQPAIWRRHSCARSRRRGGFVFFRRRATHCSP